MALLELSNISYVVKDKTIIRNVSLAINEGDYLTIVGPSGSGKSTLLKLCSDLISPTSGHITYNGQNLITIDPESYRKDVGYCFQRPYLFAKTVRRNILFPYDIRGMKPDMERIKTLFDLLHMPMEYLERRNDELSGGEMQRICLIRSLIFEPKVLLLDEVTSALDSVNSTIVEQVIGELHKNGMTIVSITHNEEQSLRLANRRITVIDGAIAKEEVLR
ncbi:ABC transporter ATP-binding protein [Veillonella sp.]